MKNLVPTLFFLCFSTSLLAQSEPKLVGYFDLSWKEVTDKENAAFYRTVEDQPDGKYLVKDYYMSGQLQMDPVICTAYTPKLQWEGNTKLYHKNGNVIEEGLFKNEDRFGLHKFWYDNGADQKVVFYNNEGVGKFHQFWSRDGNPLLTNGSGIITYADGVIEDGQSGSVLYDDVRDSIQIGAFIIELKDTIYLLVEKAPEYKKGLNAMHSVIASNTRYPKSARRSKKEGIVYVEFIVNEEGKSTKHKILKGFDKECEDQALHSTMLLNSWIPGEHRGKRIKVKFVYPIRFKLD